MSAGRTGSLVDIGPGSERGCEPRVGGNEPLLRPSVLPTPEGSITPGDDPRDTVANYEAWKRAFDSDPANRRVIP